MTDRREKKQRLVVNLRNQICPYCDTALSDGVATEDHVIARRLVPKGSLELSWNLHVNACSDCNAQKAALEDHVSAVSMHRPLVGPRQPDDLALAREAARKRQGSAGPRADRSNQKVEHHTELMPGVRMKFDLVAPPSADPRQILELAWCHVSALFYYSTFKAEQASGTALPGVFRGVQWSGRSDWGNERQRAFMGSVAQWRQRINIEAASGYFKAIIRDHPARDCWAWAVEWNKNYRVVGFFGDQVTVDELVAPIPLLVLTPVSESDDGVVGIRIERPLDQVDDCLFTAPSDESAG